MAWRRAGAVAALLLARLRAARAFPVYVAANGTTVVRAAFGSNVVLSPDNGGARAQAAAVSACVRARDAAALAGMVVVQQGLMLNNTLLAESTITALQSQVSDLQAAAAQLGNLSDLVTQYASLAPVQLSGPPDCGPPGGDRLQYVNGSWICVCTFGYVGVDCGGYDFGGSAVTLTSCGSYGAVGPTLSACRMYLSASKPWTMDSSLYSFGFPPTATNISAWQRLLLLQAGVYRITAAGAGASGEWSDRSRGAAISVSIQLPLNTTLYVLVGQSSTGTNCLGGSGGTFVLFGNGSALVVGGGGGGTTSWNAIASALYNGSDASLVSTSGNPASDGNPGGVDGNGGNGGTEYSCGGGGLFGDGVPADAFLTGAGKAAMHGGAGSSSFGVTMAYSGFGGGGATHGACGGGGGGGGYSGGGASSQHDNDGVYGSGGGGGSFCIFGLSNCTTAYNVGAGYATIELLEAYAPTSADQGGAGNNSSPVGLPLVTSLSALAAQLADLAVVPNISALVADYASLAPVQLSGPPECGPPGGDRLQYVNGSWICACADNWLTVSETGAFCSVSVTQFSGTASQAATYSGGSYTNQVAANANDGNPSCDGSLGAGVAISDAPFKSGAHDNWWQLDMGAAHIVTKVILFGRSGFYSVQFSDLNVYVGIVPSTPGQAAQLANASLCNAQPVAASASDTPAAQIGTTVQCSSVFGRYVLVYQPTGSLSGVSGYLSLCEVSVFGYDMPATAGDTALPTAHAPLVTSLSALAAQLAAQQAQLSSLQVRVTQLFSILNASTDGYGNALVSSFEPPACMPPGGDRLLYNGTAWVCACSGGWSGASCTDPPSPPPPLPPPPPPPPPTPPSPPSPPPPPIGCFVNGPNGSCLFESSSSAFVLDEVSFISAVCVGGGGSSDCNMLCAAGGGGSLSWMSSFPVSKGMLLSVSVGIGGVLYGGNNHGGPGRNGGGSSNITVSDGAVVLLARGGSAAYMDLGGQGGLASQLANTTSHSGGSGGSWYGQEGLGGWPGGGGAAGYSGNGGDGGLWQRDGFDGSGGGGGGGESHEYGSQGGGVGLFGEGPSGKGGSCAVACGIPNGNGGAGSVQYGTPAYGGGGSTGGNGLAGACRIIWGDGCTFPDNAGPQCHG